MKSVLAFCVFVLLFSAGCSSSYVWEETREITPITYSAWKEPVDRNVGRLIRVGLLPITFDFELQSTLFAGVSDRQAIENRFIEGLSVWTKNILEERKGYEVVALDTMIETLSRAPDVNEPDVHETAIARHMDVLAAWAKDSADGAEPRDRVISSVTALGGLLESDALLLISGWGRTQSDELIALVVLTASLAWPLLLAEEKVSLQADIYEVATGRIVWRSRVFDKEPIGEPEHDLHFLLLIQQLLDPLEPALPRVFTE
jgi:hypothetical protein